MTRSTLIRTLLVGGVAATLGATAVAVPLLASAATTGYEAEAATLSQAVGGANLDSLTVTDAPDWSVSVVKSTTGTTTPSTIGGWSYPVALYLYGQYLVYQRTHDPALLSFIEAWADRFVASDGTITNS